ncbi:MAG: hypothetical protein JWN44_1379 [Myxococcales bacterium]|nr:hypothetical protein [Myxococcales bacterium]
MSHLEALSRVSFDLGVFARVAKQRTRRTLVYLFLLVAISAASTTTLWTLKLRDVVRQLDPHLDEIPTITIKNGRASADVEQPWIKRLGRDDSGKQMVAIIDTTGVRQDFEEDEIGVFLKRTVLSVKTNDKQQEIPLTRFPDGTVGPDVVRAFIARWMRVVPFYLAAILCGWYLFVKSMQAFLLVLAALIGSRSRLSFGSLFNIAVYALTPAVILDAALPFVKLHVPLFWMLYFAVAIAYAVLGAQRASATPPSDDTAAL